MKKSSIVSSFAAAIVAVIAVSGIAFISFAADGDTGGTDLRRPFFKHGLSDETREQIMADKEIWLAEREVRHEAVKTALDAGDYDAWIEAIGEDAPVLEKINSGNFNRFIEAHELREQARSIMEELGVQGEGLGVRGMKVSGGHGNMLR
ncbi:hypothetical protein DRH27_04600 [Candidatus Falkowbacteria bacterium]|nr:MAG: hypothetical protein DRH27_04600 [Candidatus Falkowbacteria bacterium]